MKAIIGALFALGLTWATPAAAQKAPVYEAPDGASAKCRDGSYSFSQSRRGTCSRHGGVAAWL